MGRVSAFPTEKCLPGTCLPARQLRNVQTFIDLREAEPMLNWSLCMKGQEVVWVNPIR